MATKATSLATTAFRALVHAAKTGEVKATVEAIEKRLSLCGKCDKNVQSTCQACGCPVHRKVVPIVSTCPIGKW